MRRILSGGLLSALAVISFTVVANAQSPVVERWGNTYSIPACGKVSGTDARCFAHIVTDRNGRILAGHEPIGGYPPATLRTAYNITGTGTASTIVAIVDAFGYDDAESDLGVYRSQWGLPACTTQNGCFKKLNQEGEQKHYKKQNNGWALESALDLDMVSAMCPGCTIYLVEANTNSLKNLGDAVNTAASLGAHVISNSYGGPERPWVAEYAADYDHPGVAITVANGDSGFGVSAPADMNTVIAVGGTVLAKAQNSRGWSETVWNGTGSGCSKVFSKPQWQTDPGCFKRTVGDTAADADPGTGVAVYFDGGWNVVGGTSVATPLVGGVFGVNGGTVNAASTIYADPSALNDVTQGSNGKCRPKYQYLCNGEVGYDAPTGLGTPNGPDAF